jgi:competence protein ComEA
MKFIGKLFVITALLAGLNIQQMASAAPVSSTIPTSSTISPQDKALKQTGSTSAKGNVTTSGQVKAGHDKAIMVATTGSPSNQININSANAEQLAQFLSGVGRKKAEAIVSYREQFGPFTDTEQLLEVPGIGPSFLERNSAKLKI